MSEDKNQNFSEQDLGEEIISWVIPEYHQPERSRNWYIIAGIIGIALLAYSLFTANFLFALIIIISGAIMILIDGEEPQPVLIILTDEGLILGKNFYDYDEFKNFGIVYKPRQDVKRLYFEFNNVLKPRISLPIQDTNPLKIREALINFVAENLERTDLPLSEQLAKLFRL